MLPYACGLLFTSMPNKNTANTKISKQTIHSFFWLPLIFMIEKPTDQLLNAFREKLHPSFSQRHIFIYFHYVRSQTMKWCSSSFILMLLENPENQKTFPRAMLLLSGMENNWPFVMEKKLKLLTHCFAQDPYYVIHWHCCGEEKKLETNS